LYNPQIACPPHLIVVLLGVETFLRDNHPESEQEHDETVARVTEHHGKQERERNDRVQGWNENIVVLCATFTSTLKCI